VTGWRPARVSTAVLLALVAALAGWICLDWWAGNGGEAPPIPWTAVVGTILLATAVVAAGLPVRRWVRGVRDRVLDPLVAARTQVLAKSAAYGGAVLVGWYVAQAVAMLPDLVGSRTAHLVMAVLGALAAVGVVAAGLVVQQWCRIPPPDDEDAEETSRDG